MRLVLPCTYSSPSLLKILQAPRGFWDSHLFNPLKYSPIPIHPVISLNYPNPKIQFPRPLFFYKTCTVKVPYIIYHLLQACIPSIPVPIKLTTTKNAFNKIESQIIRHYNLLRPFSSPSGVGSYLKRSIPHVYIRLLPKNLASQMSVHTKPPSDQFRV